MEFKVFGGTENFFSARLYTGDFLHRKKGWVSSELQSLNQACKAKRTPRQSQSKHFEDTCLVLVYEAVSVSAQQKAISLDEGPPQRPQRATLAWAEREPVLTLFHGDDARQLAADGTKNCYSTSFVTASSRIAVWVWGASHQSTLSRTATASTRPLICRWHCTTPAEAQLSLAGRSHAGSSICSSGQGSGFKNRRTAREAAVCGRCGRPTTHKSLPGNSQSCVAHIDQPDWIF